MSKNDGGPTFPHQFESAQGHPRFEESTGMSLRDWFAGQALAGLHANPIWDDASHATAAQVCFDAADAMLAQREKEDG